MSFKFYLYADMNHSETIYSSAFCCCYPIINKDKYTFSQMVYLGDNIAQGYKQFIQSGSTLDSQFRYMKNQYYENIENTIATFNIDFFTKSIDIIYLVEDLILCKETTSAMVRYERLTQEELLETRVRTNTF